MPVLPEFVCKTGPCIAKHSEQLAIQRTASELQVLDPCMPEPCPASAVKQQLHVARTARASEETTCKEHCVSPEAVAPQTERCSASTCTVELRPRAREAGTASAHCIVSSARPATERNQNRQHNAANATAKHQRRKQF